MTKPYNASHSSLVNKIAKALTPVREEKKIKCINAKGEKSLKEILFDIKLKMMII